jgi:SynChlorMet cassette protein ScmD
MRKTETIGENIVMSEDRKPIANPVVVLREEFDDWAVLFNPETGDALGINAMGVFLWKRMDGRRVLKEIIKDVEDGFEGVPQTAVQEISSFVNQLAGYGLVGYAVDDAGR